MLICYAMNWAGGQRVWRARDIRKVAWELCNLMGVKVTPVVGNEIVLGRKIMIKPTCVVNACAPSGVDEMKIQ